jgi:hypothetical protein
MANFWRERGQKKPEKGTKGWASFNTETAPFSGEKIWLGLPPFQWEISPQIDN